MKKSATLVFISLALMFVIGLAGSAFSEDAAMKAPAKDSTATMAGHTCAATCAKFVDGNKDGVCDSMAVHHKDGKCVNMEQCKKDGRCPGNCQNHGAMMKTGAVKTAAAGTCDPTKCATMSGGGCPMKAKAGCTPKK
ncbi:MAG TPA: hypothetical protein VGL38_07675 [bacterium]|jgi:hypothetical protein